MQHVSNSSFRDRVKRAKATQKGYQRISNTFDTVLRREDVKLELEAALRARKKAIDELEVAKKAYEEAAGYAKRAAGLALVSIVLGVSGRVSGAIEAYHARQELDQSLKSAATRARGQWDAVNSAIDKINRNTDKIEKSIKEHIPRINTPSDKIRRMPNPPKIFAPRGIITG